MNQGHIFPQIQPTAFCQIELTPDEIRPKHSEGVVWTQNKGQFWTQHPWKPPYRVLVKLYLWTLIFWFFLFFGAAICLIGNNPGFLKTCWWQKYKLIYFFSSLLAYCHTQLLYIPGTPIKNKCSILLVSAPQPQWITACEKSLD